VVVVVAVSLLSDAHEFRKMEAIATVKTSVSFFIIIKGIERLSRLRKQF